MLFACYDVFRRSLSASEVIWGRLGGPVGVLGVIWGAPWGASGSSWGVSGVLGEPLGGPWASLGAPREGQGSLWTSFWLALGCFGLAWG